MKKFILSLALFASVPAFAQHYHGHGGHYRGGPGWGWWVAPVVTGVIGYEIARQQQQPVVVQQQPVIVQQPPVVYQPKENCGPWVETQNPDGTITRTRTCNQ